MIDLMFRKLYLLGYDKRNPENRFAFFYLTTVNILYAKRARHPLTYLDRDNATVMSKTSIIQGKNIPDIY